MYHFNEYGCKIGKTALQKKLEIQQEQQRKLLQARKKEEKIYHEKKRKYDEVMALNIEDDAKLTGVQLRALLNMKRRKTDKSLSALKKKEMLLLWKEWKGRPLETPQYDNELVHSVNEMTFDYGNTTITEIDTVECPNEEEKVESV